MSGRDIELLPFVEDTGGKLEAIAVSAALLTLCVETNEPLELGYIVVLDDGPTVAGPTGPTCFGIAASRRDGVISLEEGSGQDGAPYWTWSADKGFLAEN
ncbi:MAG: hypothetical protein HC844_19520 [Tabrizicola sp.]|nr:hypothetical protein [Tabrizicola sp.]